MQISGSRGWNIMVLLLLACLSVSGTNAQQRSIAPTGEYAQIDTRLTEKVMEVLANGSSEQKREAVEQIKASPDKYSPPAFYALSRVLFNEGKKDEAAFWFYAGQLRARFDANRSADSTAAQANAALNQTYGTPINQYTFQDTKKLEQLVRRVVEWDRKTPHNYDHRWINLHGMSAVISGLSGEKRATPLSVPKEQWNGIAEKTRATYLAELQEVIKMAARRK